MFFRVSQRGPEITALPRQVMGGTRRGLRRTSPSYGSNHGSRDRMKNPDALMVVYYVVLSGMLVFTLGYLAGWRHAKRRQ